MSDTKISNEYLNKYNSVKDFYSKEIFWGQTANDKIKEKWKNDKKIFLSRIGSVELNTINFFLDNRYKRIIKNKYPDDLLLFLKRNAGVFNLSNKDLDKFVNLYLDTLPLIDILGVWFNEKEYRCANLIKKDGLFVELAGLNSFLYHNPYTQLLQNKTVLVVHPFVKSIEKQYKIKDLLFENKDVLPDFELKLLCPPVTFAEEDTKFKNWFDAFYYLIESISKIECDVIIVGAGAYGLPIGKYFSNEKTILHLGGVTQLLFGVKGNRWIREYNYDKILFNEYWIYPSEEETPKKAHLVENKCYYGP